MRGADRPAAITAFDAEPASGDQLGPRRSGGVEQGQIQVAAGSDEERRNARAGVRQLDIDVSASVAEVAAADDDSRNRPRGSQRTQQIEGAVR